MLRICSLIICFLSCLSAATAGNGLASDNSWLMIEGSISQPQQEITGATAGAVTSGPHRDVLSAGTDLRITGELNLSERLRCEGTAGLTQSGYDFGAAFATRNLGISREDTAQDLSAGCGIHWPTPGGGFTVHGGYRLVRSDLSFSRAQVLALTLELKHDYGLSGTASGWIAGLSYFNNFYRARVRLTYAPELIAEMNGERRSTVAVGIGIPPHPEPVTGRRLIAPKTVSLSAETRYWPDWLLTTNTALIHGTGAGADAYFLPADDSFLTAPARKDAWRFGAGALYRLSDHLWAGGQFSYQQALTDAELTEAAIPETARLTIGAQARLELSERLHLNAQADWHRQNGGAILVQQNGETYSVQFGDRAGISATLGLKYLF